VSRITWRGDGKIVEGWNIFDQLGMLQQLGVVTLPNA
jgi:hypothetical protein